jgi:hypothetical protein
MRGERENRSERRKEIVIGAGREICWLVIKGCEIYRREMVWTGRKEEATMCRKGWREGKEGSDSKLQRIGGSIL